MSSRWAKFAAFLGLWSLLFACGGLAVRARASMPLLLAASSAFPVGYAIVWRLSHRLAGASAKWKRPAPFFFFLNFFVSDCLQLFNPSTLLSACAQLLALLLPRGFSRPLRPVELQLPFRGTWLVGAGGTTRRTSHSWAILAQRYAYDFVVGPSLRHSSGQGGGQLGDYPAYGQPIFAPVDGKVVAVRRTARDAPFPGSGWLDWRATDPRGNHVLIECQPGTFVLLAHLRPRSITVEPGQVVRAGTRIGECGNSGRSTEPHLHLHCQRGRGLAFAVGLPIVFPGCSAIPATKGEGAIERGMQVTPRENGQ